MITTIKEFKLFESKNIGILYHFTHFYNIIEMLEDEIFIAKYNDLPKYNYDYAISCTRNKSFQWGLIRMSLDGNKISQKFVIKPVSYSKLHSQSEERIFTNNETFPIFNYLVQIDIHSSLVNNPQFEQLKRLLIDKHIKYNIVNKFI